jgi:hypothetical protein
MSIIPREDTGHPPPDEAQFASGRMVVERVHQEVYSWVEA